MAEAKALFCLVALVFLRGLQANPLDSYASVLQATECGGSSEVTISLTDTVTFSSAYLTELNDGALPQDCEIHWRIALENIDGLENWGIEVQGTVALEDEDNVDGDCSSSSLKITDEDAEGDLAAVTQVVCGSQDVEFVTYEDSVSIILSTTSSAITGDGFVLSFKPVFGCGGKMDGESGDSFVISSAGYPNPYPKDLSCMWDLTVPESSTVSLYCSQFRLMKRFPMYGKQECMESLRINSAGTYSHYCYKDLRKNKKTWTGLQHMDFYFRSYSKAYNLKGFKCEISIV